MLLIEKRYYKIYFKRPDFKPIIARLNQIYENTRWFEVITGNKKFHRNNDLKVEVVNNMYFTLDGAEIINFEELLEYSV